jgi:uncharacterized protein
LLAILDSGPLVAALDPADPKHEVSLAVFRRPDIEFVIPSLCVTEVAYFAGIRAGSLAEARFIRSLASLRVEPFLPDLTRIADIIEQYADFPLGAVDASVVALAERLDCETVVTIDRRHFSAVRPRHVPAFRLLPE